MMDDLISRQAALECVKKVCLEVLDSVDTDANTEEDCIRYTNKLDAILTCNKEIRSALRDLPPAQDNADEWCVDCKEYDQEQKCCPRWNRVIRQTLDDAIIRCKDCRWWDKYNDSDWGYCMAAKHGHLSRNWEISIYRKYKGDFFCADAERSEEEEEEAYV